MNNNDRTFERIESLFDVQLFAEVKVLVAGCGSGGASVALQLVMSGIRNLTLMDRDTLGPENVIRHVCGRSFIGRKKTAAVADDVRATLLAAFERSAEVEASQITVDVVDGTIKLGGRVDSWLERQEVERAAWSVPGVIAFDDNIAVEPR